MPAWLLPDHIADVLPAQARKVEELRRRCLDCARSFGYELVMPPMLEYVDSLLTGTGRDLDLKTFKLTDQLSGKTLGVRADITPQVARIDAHLLNRDGVVRLCYAGSVLHSLARGALSSRELLQFGAELYGHAGIEADHEVLDLAQRCLGEAGVEHYVVDLADARILRALLAGTVISDEQHDALLQALTQKDGKAIADILSTLTIPLRKDQSAALMELPALYGGMETLSAAEKLLPDQDLVRRALRDLRAVASRLPPERVNIDFADMRGYHYYTGITFAVYVDGAQASLLRGGRYDEVGAAFGRARPAAGFSLDLRELAMHSPVDGSRKAVLAPWGDDPALREAIARLRAEGETVVVALPAQAHAPDEYTCDRALRLAGGRWCVQPIKQS